MPKPASKKPPTWRQVLEGAERLDERYHRGTQHRDAVLCAMLARVVEQAPTRPAPRAVFSAKLFGKPRPPVLSPLQQRMAERRRMAYEF